MPMGGMELLIILVIILLFFGAKRIPELGRSLGRGKREFRRGALEDTDNDQLDNEQLREREENEKLPPREEASR